MFLSLSTACLYHLPLRTTFRLAAETGFDGVELVMGPEVWVRGSRHVATLAREYGLTVYSVHQTLLRASPRGGHARRIEDAVATALELDAPRVVIHDPGWGRWADPQIQLWLRIVVESQERLRGRGVRLALENPGQYQELDGHGPLGQIPLLLSFCQRHDLDITYDTCHAGTAGLDLLQTYRALRERLVNVHLSDLKTLALPTSSLMLHSLLVHHQMPGDGCLPLVELLAQMSTDGYAGPVTMEISMAGLHSWSIARARKRLEHLVRYVRAAIGT